MRRILSGTVVVIAFVVAALVTPSAAQASADNCAPFVGTFSILPLSSAPLVVSAELARTGNGYGQLRARSATVGPWEKFSIVCWDAFAGTVAIQSQASHQFVSAEVSWTGNSYGLLRARAASVGPWEKFHFGWTDTSTGFYMQSLANGRYVSVERSWTGDSQNELRARATSVGPWEQFVLTSF